MAEPEGGGWYGVLTTCVSWKKRCGEPHWWTLVFLLDRLDSSTLRPIHYPRAPRGWEPKTREWHETSLGQMRRYVAWRKLLLLSSLTSSEIQGWLTFLRTEALITGAFRVRNTISTYARSAHAFCAWLVGQGYLEQSPFARMPFPKGTKRRLRIIEQETFQRVLDACHAAKTKRPPIIDFATARNRALLWVLWDTGLLVSEVCARPEMEIQGRKLSKQKMVAKRGG